MKKFNQKKFAAFKKSRQSEVYSSKEGTYDIVKAEFICQDKETQMINVEQEAEKCGFHKRPCIEDGYEYYDNAVIDIQHAQRLFDTREIDTTKPLIFLPSRKLIDGHHRLHQAYMLGRADELEAYVLTEEEAKMC